MAKKSPVKIPYENFYKITSSKVIAYARPIENIPRKYKEIDSAALPREKKASAYSIQAEKRFNAALDNLCSMMKAAKQDNPDYLFYNYKGAIHTRKLVFMTLTIPVQEASDKDIKRKALGNVLENLKRSYSMCTFLWKGEKQERGALHFHIVTDAFIPEGIIRYMWFRNLKRLGCIPESLRPSKASRLVHFKVIENLDTAFCELSGYFAGERDENGTLIHKHDAKKRVKDVEGRSWGCSDNLRYKQMTIFDIIEPVRQEIHDSAKMKFEVEGNNGNTVATVFIRKIVKYNPQRHIWYAEHTPTKLDRHFLDYHREKAQEVWHGSCSMKKGYLYGEDKKYFKFEHKHAIPKTIDIMPIGNDRLSIETALRPSPNKEDIFSLIN